MDSQKILKCTPWYGYERGHSHENKAMQTTTYIFIKTFRIL